MMRQKQRDFFQNLIVGIAVSATLSFASLAQARDGSDRLDFLLGAYSLTATSPSSDKSGSLSGFGVYSAGYRHAFTKNVEFVVGYTLFATSVITGDYGYGPDLGIAYYPFNSVGPSSASSETVTFKSEDSYKPFVIGAFHQRNFQSVNSSYAGFSLGGGSEFYFNPNFNFKFEIRYMQLVGPSDATATQIDILGGISFGL